MNASVKVEDGRLTITVPTKVYGETANTSVTVLASGNTQDKLHISLSVEQKGSGY